MYPRQNYRELAESCGNSLVLRLYAVLGATCSADPTTGPEITATLVAAGYPISLRQAQRAAKALARAGLLQRTGSGWKQAPWSNKRLENNWETLDSAVFFWHAEQHNQAKPETISKALASIFDVPPLANGVRQQRYEFLQRHSRKQRNRVKRAPVVSPDPISEFYENEYIASFQDWT
jgi:hypothetical protein